MARADRKELSEHDQANGGGAAATVPPRVVVAYGSTYGTTEAVAQRLAATLEVELGRTVTLADVAWTEPGEIALHDVMILGSSTWDHGQLQADWEAAVDRFVAHDLRGRRVAVFGCGDLAGYPETFGDALGILRDRASAAGAEPFGRVAATELGFAVSDVSGSQASDGEHLAGLLLDDAEDDQTRDARTDAWAALLAHEIRRRALHAKGAPDRDKLRRQLVRRTLAGLLDDHPGVLDVLARHGADRRSASRHEVATLVPLRALLAGLCAVDDPVATLDDVVEHVRDEILSRNGSDAAPGRESLSTS